MRVQGSVAAIVVLSTVRSLWAAPLPQALDAWTRYVASVEARLNRASGDDAGCDTRAWGETIAVESGTIVDWHGRTCIPGITVNALVDRLLHPETDDTSQEDVAAARVLERGTDFVRMYL